MKCCSFIIALVFVQVLFSCSTDKNGSKTENSPPPIVEKSQENSDLPVKPKHLYLHNDSICVIADKSIYCIKRDMTIDYKHSYAGIYEILGDSIKKSYSLAINNLIYFTTYADGSIGHKGYLYVFDRNKRTLVTDRDFKHNYLYSFWGMFIIDRKTNKIFSINPGWYDEKTVPVVAASMYAVKGAKFKFYKFIYQQFNNVQQDSNIVKFYHKSLVNNGKNGFMLPERWWK